MFKLFKKEKIFNNIKKKDSEEHKGLCSSEVCLETLKELEKTMVTNWNIWKWKKQLKRCNKCYLEQKNHSYLNAITRGSISSEVIYFNKLYWRKDK